MDKIVKNLYDDLNLTTIPEIIKKEFYKRGYWYDKDIFIKPYNSRYNFEIEDLKLQFNTHSNIGSLIDRVIKNNSLLNENYDIINYNEFQREYIKEFGLGFYDGYISYTKELKDKNNLIFEPDNKQIAYKIFSKVIKKKSFRIVDSFPLTLIPFEDAELVKKKHNSEIDFYFAVKKKYNEAGFKSGEKYKAWELILQNPTLFEKIFVEQLGKPENNQLEIIETPELNLKEIPTLNLQQRYYLFTKLNLDNSIHTIESSKQTAKHKILALLMGISPDNAKHLLNGTYKDLTLEHKEEVDEYLLLQKIKL